MDIVPRSVMIRIYLFITAAVQKVLSCLRHLILLWLKHPLLWHKIASIPLKIFALITLGAVHAYILATQSQFMTSAGHKLSVTFKAGYGTNPATVPSALVHATLMLAAQMYENRLGTCNDNTGLPILMNKNIRNLIKPYQFLRLI